MTAELIDGVKISARVREEVKEAVAKMPVKPGLATILVGDDPGSAIYVASKRRTCVELGIRDLHRHLPSETTQEELAELITQLSADPEVTAILLQLPVPKHLDPRALIELIHPDKDVDGLSILSAGRLARHVPGPYPCTPLGVIELLDSYHVDIRGTDAVVVGRSQLVGWPLAQMLLQRDATVTSCHSGTRNLVRVCRHADILIAAAGVRGLIDADYVRPGATVIDVGIHRTDDGLQGDVDFDGVAEVADLITPVPGGVGPMTIAMLMRNTLRSALLQGYDAGEPESAAEAAEAAAGSVA
ncbi:MAG TPA: bifunctional 5,10-methylenetetrahydrofolate dehydrogenase/5,10-methenyltetrahydrofolate cyclohydrolase [Solirubrobacteraceae bacterium]|nr:bifunctional 5,10-methylenetetrahydrofolate dehydrogenase/5,10-methenyltetrahydrofolate cyclohydrolase [Solirubrobacteraceae bacterium]